MNPFTIEPFNPLFLTGGDCSMPSSRLRVWVVVAVVESRVQISSQSSHPFANAAAKTKKVEH